uniref:Secreted protein n=1 Tax=Mesocestoides corti TaxID=53468 RepID=A0A5K3FI36_MESCO
MGTASHPPPLLCHLSCVRTHARTHADGCTDTRMRARAADRRTMVARSTKPTANAHLSGGDLARVPRACVHASLPKRSADID